MAHTRPAPPTPAQITADIFKLFDANGDHSITLAEITAKLTALRHGHAPKADPLAKLFAAIDADHSGGLSVAEVTTAVTAALATHHAPAHLAHDNAHQLLAALGSALHHEGLI
jgi:Ca2+-binding EF-hand superfamily protein